MPIRTSSYEFTADTATYRDPVLEIDLSRNNDLNRFVIHPRRESEPKLINFVTILRFTTESGDRMTGGGLLGITSQRLVGVITEGDGTSGAVAEPLGCVEAFSIDFDAIASATFERNWRGKPKSLELCGTMYDPFVLVVEEIIGVVTKGGNQGEPAGFDEFVAAIKRLNGRIIDI